jgi:hypothetical protein
LQETLFDLPHFISMRSDEEGLLAADIEAVAVWDTVGSLGIPEFTLQEGRVDGFQLADLNLNAKVHHGLHAIAIDEQRDDFTPTLWNADPRITQVLFPGCHSDVGGGYPTAKQGGLSDCALVWMADQLEKLGVLFSQSPKYNANPLASGASHQPWLEAPWTLLPHRPRTFRPGLCLSQCVIDRCSAALDPAYASGNLLDYLVNGGANPRVTVAGA